MIVICRDRVLGVSSVWAQKLAPPIDAEVVELCGQTGLCQRQDSLCTVSWNGRPVRFVDQFYPKDGDILELEIEGRNPFCVGPGSADYSVSSTQFAGQSSIAESQDTDQMMLLQKHSVKLGSGLPGSAAGEIGELYPISCRRCHCLVRQADANEYCPNETHSEDPHRNDAVIRELCWMRPPTSGLALSTAPTMEEQAIQYNKTFRLLGIARPGNMPAFVIP